MLYEYVWLNVRKQMLVQGYALWKVPVWNMCIHYSSVFGEILNRTHRLAQLSQSVNVWTFMSKYYDADKRTVNARYFEQAIIRKYCLTRTYTLNRSANAEAVFLIRLCNILAFPNAFPHVDVFGRLCSGRHLKTLWQNEHFFCHKVFNCVQ